jgi:predicted ATPase with chaperone activity
MMIVGLPDTAVQESRERVQSALSQKADLSLINPALLIC